MENEKAQEKKVDHEAISGRPRFVVGTLIVLLGLILLSGMFMLGGAFSRRVGVAKVERFGAIGNVGMMGGGLRAGGMHMRGQQLLGSVSAINGSTITVHNSSADTSVMIQSTTSFYKAGQVAKQSDLKVGDVVTVRGTPDSSGVVQATIIDIR